MLLPHKCLIISTGSISSSSDETMLKISYGVTSEHFHNSSRLVIKLSHVSLSSIKLRLNFSSSSRSTSIFGNFSVNFCIFVFKIAEGIAPILDPFARISVVFQRKYFARFCASSLVIVINSVSFGYRLPYVHCLDPNNSESSLCWYVSNI